MPWPHFNTKAPKYRLGTVDDGHIDGSWRGGRPERSSKYMPHQGKREMERRRNRATQ
jgi:hypothetical protein